MSVPRYNKDYPFLATVLERRCLTGVGHKDIRHIVLGIKGSEFAYEAGDSIGIYPTNHIEDVELLLTVLEATGEEMVPHPKTGKMMALKEALCKHFSLIHVPRGLLTLFKDHANGAERERLEEILMPEAELAYKGYTHGRDIIDVAQDFPLTRVPLDLFVKELRRLLPRLYSIASSPKMYPDEVHLTIGVTQAHHHGRLRLGVASNYLAQRVPLGEPFVPSFLAKSHFRIPSDDEVDMIMVGPGTGIAPFRAFIQERSALKAKGRNWLFFGEQHRASGFLYQAEWEAALQDKTLHRLDLAFSRDQEAKVYVQDRLLEVAEEVWAWLQGGAHFYVCGDADHMALGVDQVLHRIAQTVGGLSEAQAGVYFKELKKDKRYQRDVY